MREGWKRQVLDAACDITYGTRVTKKQDAGTAYPVYGGGGETFRLDRCNREDCTIVARFGMSESCVRHVAGKFFLNDSGLSLTPKDPKKLFPRFLDYFLYASQSAIYRLGRGSAQKNLDVNAFRQLELCYPESLPEQKRIVAILDEAFSGIATAVANTETNLANARELFRTSLAIFFSQYRELPERLTAGLLNDGPPDASGGPFSDGSFLAAKSSTRGRAETDRIIEGKLSLSVGMPSIQPRRGWRWTKLTNVARLESGHTPSRKRPEYWGGDIPWLGITDARAYHGRVIEDTEQHTNQLGIDNSAARVLPAGTVCLSRTASVGYVVITGAAMATSQDFVNWVCSSELEPHFLKYLLQSEWRDFSRFSSGSVHQTIYFPEVKAFHICHPGLREQKRIVEFLDEMRANTASLESICQQKLNALAELKQALLYKAFSGELTAETQDELETALA